MKKQTASRCWCQAAFVFAVPLAQAQTSIIPQIVDGGPWLTTIAITNTSASTATASLIFFQETGGGNTASWPLGFDEMTTTQVQSLVLQGGNTLFLHTPGTAANTTIGWHRCCRGRHQPDSGAIRQHQWSRHQYGHR
jgi:hypothetical protein